MKFSISRSGIPKFAIAFMVLTGAFIAAAVGYYTATHPPSPTASPTSTPSPEPTTLPTPTFLSPTITAPTPTATTSPMPTSSISPSPTLTPNPSEQTTPEKVRDAAMNFIKSNHPETAQFMTDLVWTGGRITPPNTIGAETYMYYAEGWNCTINYPVVPNAIYNIIADYSALSTSIPYRIIWKGTWQNEIINEKSYVFAQ